MGAREPAEIYGAEMQQEAHMAAPKLNILIVDDDPDICLELASVLGDRGHSVHWLTDPQELNESFGYRPEIIILDLGMPSRDGFDIIDHWPAQITSAQLIIASGHDTKIIRAAARRAEAKGVRVLGSMRKPYSPSKLFELLEGYNPEGKAGLAQPSTGTIKDLLDRRNLGASIAVAFQEKRSLKTEGISGYEALLRSNLPGYGNPELFFQRSVPLDLQIDITNFVIGQVLATVGTLPIDIRGVDPPVSVNCTPDILCHPSFIMHVERLLATHPLIYQTIAFEITEHNTLETVDEITTAAGRLSVKGFHIALDDFGVGINNVDSLMNLHCDEVKIDKKIFWQFFANRSSDSIAREVVKFCQSAGIRTTIEGIETRDHLEYARDLGADYGQGFLWGRPFIVTAQQVKAARS